VALVVTPEMEEMPVLRQPVLVRLERRVVVPVVVGVQVAQVDMVVPVVVLEFLVEVPLVLVVYQTDPGGLHVVVEVVLVVMLESLEVVVDCLVEVAAVTLVEVPVGL
jgi:hypothetical protein